MFGRPEPYASGHLEQSRVRFAIFLHGQNLKDHTAVLEKVQPGLIGSSNTHQQ